MVSLKHNPQQCLGKLQYYVEMYDDDRYWKMSMIMLVGIEWKMCVLIMLVGIE